MSDDKKKVMEHFLISIKNMTLGYDFADAKQFFI